MARRSARSRKLLLTDEGRGDSSFRRAAGILARPRRASIDRGMYLLDTNVVSDCGAFVRMARCWRGSVGDHRLLRCRGIPWEIQAGIELTRDRSWAAAEIDDGLTKCADLRSPCHGHGGLSGWADCAWPVRYFGGRRAHRGDGMVHNLIVVTRNVRDFQPLVYRHIIRSTSTRSER